MRRIVITQINFDGQGGDRVQTRWVKPGQVATTIRQIERAYNMYHTKIETV